jgi:hypothetical protein
VVDKEVRAFVSIDWSSAPKGDSTATLTVTGPNGTTVVVNASASNPTLTNRLDGFIESNGYISIQADHYSKAVGNETISWLRIPDIGRTGAGMEASPVNITPIKTVDATNGPHLEYNINTFTTGNLIVWAYMSPRNDVLRTNTADSNTGQKPRLYSYAISIDDGEPVYTNIIATTGANPGTLNSQWGWYASNQATNLSTTFNNVSAGSHVIKFWMLDPTVVLQNIIVDTGGLLTSYFGPPESMADFAPNAALTDLQVDGKTVSGFSSSVYSYSVPVFAGPLPQVTATANDAGATVDIVQTPEIPGTATVTVTVGSAQTVYKINFPVDTTLSDLQVNGVQPGAFSSSVTAYTLVCSGNIKKIPQVTATSTDPGATVAITQAPTVPGQAAVTVTVGDAQTVYTVAFSFTEGKADNFTSDTLGSQWEWIREDSSNWSLSKNPGFMTITSQTGNLNTTTNTANNILLQDCVGDWTIESKLVFSVKPHNATQQGGIIACQDDDNYLKVDWEYYSFWWWSYTRFAITKEINGTASTPIYLTADSIVGGDNTVWGPSETPTRSRKIVTC